MWAERNQTLPVLFLQILIISMFPGTQALRDDFFGVSPTKYPKIQLYDFRASAIASIESDNYHKPTVYMHIKHSI